MFIPRSQGDSRDCSLGPAFCGKTLTIVGNDPLPGDGDDSAAPSGYDKPGPHRFIGIGMVIGMFIVVLILWMYFGKWPRSMFAKHCCCCSRKEIGSTADSTPDPTKPDTSSPEEKDVIRRDLAQGMRTHPQQPSGPTKTESYPMR